MKGDGERRTRDGSQAEIVGKAQCHTMHHTQREFSASNKTTSNTRRTKHNNVLTVTALLLLLTTRSTSAVTLYEERTSGTCADVIETKERCEAAARMLGWPDTAFAWTRSQLPSGFPLEFPYGCYLNNNELFYNGDTASGTPCSSADKCACILVHVHLYDKEI